MRNISLKGKIFILVAILTTTILAVALMGGWQLHRTNAQMQQLVNVTNRSVGLASDLRVAMLDAIRAEKNAVIAPNNERSNTFAQQAREHSQQIESVLLELRDTVSLLSEGGESRELEEFQRGWEAFSVNQAEVLRLATLNTNTRGKQLLNGQIIERVRESEQMLSAVQSRVRSESVETNAPTEPTRLQHAHQVDHLTGRALYLAAHLVDLLHSHLDAAKETEFNRLDAEISECFGELDGILGTIRPMVDNIDLMDIGQVIMHVQSFKKLSAELQELSRVNSNQACATLTLTKTVELGNKCDMALTQLIKTLRQRAEEGKNSAQAGYHRAVMLTAGTGVVGIAAGLLLGWLITESITRPVTRGVELAQALAQGDLTRRLSLDQRDEIGRLTGAIDHAAENFATIITQIHDVSEQIGASATELGTVSHHLLAQSEEMSTQAGFVAGSTEQMTSNINTMAAAAEQMSMNVASISSASEQISVNVATISSAADHTSGNVGSVVEAIQDTSRSFEQIAEETRQGAQTTAKAAELAANATATMNTLDRSAVDINKVTEMIKLIAMQTNLLALNATIEATSAGEAGKGFAVVANEIKELANQSGKAAEDIARMIQSIQGNTRDAVAVIKDVADMIQKINAASDRIFKSIDAQTRNAAASAEKLGSASHSVGNIAQSITEVAKGATDMSRNASEAASAANDVSHNASQAARAAQEISSNIRGVSEATKENTTSAQHVNQAAARLQSIAARLEQIVGQFRVSAEAQPAA
jgi:methyl-accepting chemotaxis protein